MTPWTTWGVKPKAHRQILKSPVDNVDKKQKRLKFQKAPMGPLGPQRPRDFQNLTVNPGETNDI
jgi:hypothetical protein